MGTEPVAAPGVGVAMPPVLPVEAGGGVSGIGWVTAGAAVLAGGVLGGIVVVLASFLPQAARASKADSATTVTGVRRFKDRGVMGASFNGSGGNA